MLHQEATNVPDADGAVQVLLLQEHLALFDGLLGVLAVHPAESTDSLSPNRGRGWGVRGSSSRELWDETLFLLVIFDYAKELTCLEIFQFLKLIFKTTI